jgi:DNA sulfur modification protein DndD
VIFRRIEMDNFGIFYGHQGLDLDAGLYVLHGENGRGKTTIINAVKWVFFGTYLSRQGKPVSADLVLNQDAQREGTTRFGATLVMTDGQVEIRATRTCELGTPPTSSLYVERDGQSLNKEGSEHLLRNLLDQQVSRFFLFDGEQLQKYEELLFEEEEAAILIKDSIEQILGLPVLENAIADLSAVAAEIGKQITKSARLSDKTKRQGEQAEQIELEIASANEDLEALQTQAGEAEEKIAAADVVLQKDEAARDIVNKAEAVEAEIEAIERQRNEATDDRTEALAETWRDVLAGAVASKRTELEAEVEAQRKAEEEGWRSEQIEASLERGSCEVCEQKVEGAVVEAMRERLNNAAAAAEEGSNGRADLQGVLVALADIGGTGDLARAVKFDSRISDCEVQTASKRQELQRIRDSIKGISEEEIRSAGDSRDAAQQDLGEVKHRIAGVDGVIVEKHTTLQDLRRQISAAGETEEMAVLSAREERAKQLASLCEAAKARYRDNLRSRVEADASEIFMRLTTEPSHAGLRINASYGLEILDAGGEVVPGRSAGQEQIVALSLIGALNRNASRQAPVMMDTPFGRLDEQHRRKVLAFLAEMAEQVFLLVHSAEVNRTDLDEIAASITAEKTLKRRSLSQTELRPYEGNA